METNFDGKLSWGWLAIQGRVITSTGKIKEEYIWRALIMGVLLQMLIKLWELQKEEVRGKEENEKQHKHEEKEAKKV